MRVSGCRWVHGISGVDAHLELTLSKALSSRASHPHHAALTCHYSEGRITQYSSMIRHESEDQSEDQKAKM